MIKTIAIDLDGTLFDKDKNISKENKEAIKYAKDKGIYVVICTGRPFNGVKPVLEQLNINSNEEYVICYNGAKVFNVGTSELVYSSTISGKDVKDLYIESVKLNTCFHAFKKNEDLICNCDNPYTEVEKRINKLDAEIVDFTKIDESEEYLKAMMVHEKDILDTATPGRQGLRPEGLRVGFRAEGAEVRRGGGRRAPRPRTERVEGSGVCGEDAVPRRTLLHPLGEFVLGFASRIFRASAQRTARAHVSRTAELAAEALESLRRQRSGH